MTVSRTSSKALLLMKVLRAEARWVASTRSKRVLTWVWVVNVRDSQWSGAESVISKDMVRITLARLRARTMPIASADSTASKAAIRNQIVNGSKIMPAFGDVLAAQAVPQAANSLTILVVAIAVMVAVFWRTLLRITIIVLTAAFLAALAAGAIMLIQEMHLVVK